MIRALKAEWRERTADHRGPLFNLARLLATLGAVVAVNYTGLLDERPVPALIVVALAVIGANTIAAFTVRFVRRVRRPEAER